MLRRRTGLTQVELGFLLDVSAQTIFRWETGSSEPSASEIRKLALALRVPETDVLEAVIGAKQAS